MAQDDTATLETRGRDDAGHRGAAPGKRRIENVGRPAVLRIYEDVIPFRCLITPKDARTLLARPHSNRPENRNTTKHYGAMHAAGHWQLNGETIKLAKGDGHVIDGQHRLQMVVDTDRPLDTIVVAGLDPEVFATIDYGRRRTFANFLAIKNYPQSVVLASVTLQQWRYERGFLDTQSRGGAAPRELFEVLQRHPEMGASVRRSARAHDVLRPSIAAWLHYRFAQQDPLLADEFIDRMATGADMPSGHPWLQLRTHLIRYRKGNARPPAVEALFVTIVAWNMVRQGKLNGTIPKLRSRIGDAFEPIPEIV